MILKTLKDSNLIGRFFKLSLLFLVVFACSDVQKRPNPERLLTEDEMVEVYTDMMIIDAVNRTNPKIYTSYDLDIKEHIYNKYKIDSTILADNIIYYNLEFDANVRIFERVNQNILDKKDYFDSIGRAKDSLDKLKKNIERDSLKKSLQKNAVLQKEVVQTEDSSKVKKPSEKGVSAKSMIKQN
jgi:hypothetical protein